MLVGARQNGGESRVGGPPPMRPWARAFQEARGFLSRSGSLSVPAPSTHMYILLCHRHIENISPLKI